jgi:hypothetical protein
MITCPMCKKKLRGLEKECGNCRTDVSLLVSYVEQLRSGLARAGALTRAGELGEAVWAYLSVLEVDPDNSEARKQVGQVVTAVRQFDQTAPARRWNRQIQKETRFRRWFARANEEGDLARWLAGCLWFLLVLGAVLLGYVVGLQSAAKQGEQHPGQNEPGKQEPAKPQPGKQEPRHPGP